jgi:hypothetical protein
MGPGGDLSRRASEALAAEEYRRGRLTKPDLRRLLGFETGHQIDGFLRLTRYLRTTLWKTWSASARACGVWLLMRLESLTPARFSSGLGAQRTIHLESID